MKAKTFQPIVIGHDVDLENKYVTSTDTKKKRFNELTDYLQLFVSTENINSFEGRIYDEFITRFYDKHHENFPSLTIHKIAELHSCQLHKVDALIDSFESIKMDWDLEKNHPKHEAPDFRILTTNENENKLFNALTKIVDSIENAQAIGLQFYPAPILNGLNGWMSFDFNTNKMLPNISRIQGNERNY